MKLDKNGVSYGILLDCLSSREMASKLQTFCFELELWKLQSFFYQLQLSGGVSEQWFWKFQDFIKNTTLVWNWEWKKYCFFNLTRLTQIFWLQKKTQKVKFWIFLLFYLPWLYKTLFKNSKMFWKLKIITEFCMFFVVFVKKNHFFTLFFTYLCLI
jgi:hypothetical protein